MTRAPGFRADAAAHPDGLSGATPARSVPGLDGLALALRDGSPRPMRGRLVRAIGTVLRAVMPDARVGELCRLEDPGLPQPLMAEVVGLDGDEAVLAPIGDVRGLSIGAEVVATRDVLRVPRAACRRRHHLRPVLPHAAARG